MRYFPLLSLIHQNPDSQEECFVTKCKVTCAHPGTRIVTSFSYPYFTGYSPELGNTNIITRLAGDTAGILRKTQCFDFWLLK